MSTAATPDLRSYWLRRALQLHSHLWFHRVSAEITSIQFGVLRSLRDQGDLGQRELGRQGQLDKSTLAELLRRLERNGLVATDRDAADRRRKTVSLTEAGARVVAELEPKALEVNELLATPLSGTEAAELDRLLAKLLGSDLAKAAAIR